MGEAGGIAAYTGVLEITWAYVPAGEGHAQPPLSIF